MSTDSIDIPLDDIEQMVREATGQPLSKLQKLVLSECWSASKKTYQEIATESNYSYSYIQQRVAPALWRLLSEITGEKVSKSNFRSVILKYTAKRAVAQEVLTAMEPSVKSITEELNAEEKDAEELVTEGWDTEPLDAETETSETETTASIAPHGRAVLSNKKTVEALPMIETPTGSLSPESPFYIQRTAEEAHCYQAIAQPGALIRITAPEQMGKTSLIRRILANAEPYSEVTINCRMCDRAILSDLNLFLRWFCKSIGRQLGIPSALDAYWDEEIGNKMSCTLYIEEHILHSLDDPFILAIDEASSLFDYSEVAEEFFTMLRTWHEYTKYDGDWQKLRLILAQSTENYVPLDINRSPFNVGMTMTLGPFSQTQVMTLAHLHGIDDREDNCSQLFSLVSGHPHLVRIGLYQVARGSVSWEQLFTDAATDESIFSHHLHRHLWSLKQHPELRMAFRAVLDRQRLTVLDQMHGFKLHSMGLITLRQNKAQVSCELYQQYFRKRLSIND